MRSKEGKKEERLAVKMEKLAVKMENWKCSLVRRSKVADTKFLIYSLYNIDGLFSKKV